MFVVPYTIPFNAVVCPPVSEVSAGAMATDTLGTNAMVAVAYLVASATLRTVTVAVCDEVSPTGTV